MGQNWAGALSKQRSQEGVISDLFLGRPYLHGCLYLTWFRAPPQCEALPGRMPAGHRGHFQHEALGRGQPRPPALHPSAGWMEFPHPWRCREAPRAVGAGGHQVRGAEKASGLSVTYCGGGRLQLLHHGSSCGHRAVLTLSLLEACC